MYADYDSFFSEDPVKKTIILKGLVTKFNTKTESLHYYYYYFGMNVLKREDGSILIHQKK